MTKQKAEAKKTVRIFTDGAGCRPDGKGSKFAWLRENDGLRKVVPEDELTNNQAEYKAILSAIEFLPQGENAEILTDSENTCFQLKGERRIKDPKLGVLAAKIHSSIAQKNLKLTFTWIPRRDNRAGKLI